MMPERVAHLAAADAAKLLMDELRERPKLPVTFHLAAQPGSDDALAERRKLVELGVLMIDKAVPDSAAVPAEAAIGDA